MNKNTDQSASKENRSKPSSKNGKSNDCSTASKDQLNSLLKDAVSKMHSNANKPWAEFDSNLNLHELLKTAHSVDENSGNIENEQSIKAPPVDMTAPCDWQCDFINPMQRFNKLFELGHLADVTITFPSSPCVLKAHRLVLATASPVLEKMFYGDSKEATTGKVCFHDCSPDAMKWIMQNLYTGNTNFPSVLVALTVFNIAQMYQMSGILALCRNYLKFELSISNINDVFDVAYVHEEEQLMNACLKKLFASWNDVVKEGIAEVTEEMWIYILKRTVLPTPEVDLLRGLVAWGKAQVEHNGTPPTPERIRARIQKFLPHIRLLSIPSDKFIDYVMPTQIFSPEECSGILMRLRGFAAPLPVSVTCSNIPFSRISVNEGTLRYVVLQRVSDSKRSGATDLCEFALLKNFQVSSPILLNQVFTTENLTLRGSVMTLTDGDDHQVGIAKPLGPSWKFTTPAFLHANKTYTVTVDKALLGRLFIRRDFCTHSSDVRFKGSTGDTFIKLAFWPTEIKSN